MLDRLCFTVFLIIIAIILEVRTHQRRRVFVASSGLFVIVLYFTLFDLVKDQSTITLLVKFRPDLLIDTIQPFIAKLVSYNIFENNAFFIKLLNAIGIKEGTRLFTFITTFKPAASDSPFTGISVDSSLAFLKHVLSDYIDFKIFERYALKIKKIAYGYVMILCEGLEKVKFNLVKMVVNIKEYYFVA